MCTARKNPVGSSLIQSPQGSFRTSVGRDLERWRPARVARPRSLLAGKNPAPTDTNLGGEAALEPDRAERAAVAAWRRRHLAEAGFPRGWPLRSPQRGVDVHALIELVERGCRPRLAARILAPLDRSRRDQGRC